MFNKSYQYNCAHVFSLIIIQMPVRVCDFGFMVRHIKRGIGLYTLPLDIAIIGTVMLQKMLLPGK